MGRYGKVGRFNQVMHPRIRGSLDPSGEQRRARVVRLQDYKTDEETYFVPSFSIRRHLHRSEESAWNEQRRSLQRYLGRSFSTTPTDDVALKVVEQHRFIKNFREAGIRPDPEEIRDLAYSLRDQLTELLSNAHSPLDVPLGGLGRFGYKGNKLAYNIDGWRGDRAHYGENDDEAYMDTHSVLLEERRFALDAIASAFEGAGLQTDRIAPSPHLTIASTSNSETIPDYRIRSLQKAFTGFAMEGVLLGDPIITMRLHRGAPAESLYVRHAWDSLGLREPAAELA